jgi:hypothetical protein
MTDFHTDATRPKDILAEYLDFTDAPESVREAFRKLNLQLKQAKTVARRLRQEDDDPGIMGFENELGKE